MNAKTNIHNIYADQFQSAELFGKPVLYTEKQVHREAVPENWHCYDLSGTERGPTKPAVLEDVSTWDRVGTVLSPVPLKRSATQARLVKDGFHLHGELLDLAGFCEKNRLDCPQDPRKYALRPASPGKETELFYSLTDSEQDAAAGTIGHLRMYFERGGGFRHSWWPHNDDRLNTPDFKRVLQDFVDELRVRGPLQSDAAMRRWCYGHPGGEVGEGSVGFVAETADYRFCLRCTTRTGDYCYLYCYDLNQQRLATGQTPQQYGLSGEGLQRLRDAADPGKPHTYDWYVIENINTPAERMERISSLADAVRAYTALTSDDKRLGVTKDDIASVDLVIRQGSREWVSEDWLKLDSFKSDPVAAGAVIEIQRALDERTTTSNRKESD